MDNNFQLNEFLDLSPIGLDSYIIVDNEHFYSSKKIEGTVTTWLSSSNISKPILGKIKEGLNNKYIVVGYEDTGKVKFIFNRILGGFREVTHMSSTDSGIVLGAFYKKERKLIIVLDKNVDLFGRIIKEIPPIINHEIIHMCANYNLNQFLRTTLNNYILPYMKYVCENISKKTKDIPDKELIKTIVYLSKYFDAGNPFSNPTIHTAANIWENYFKLTNESPDKINIMVKAILMPYMNGFLDVKSDKELGQRVSKIMYNAYHHIGADARITRTLVGQEVLYPSEIVCIGNQFKLEPSIYKLINNTKFI